MLKAIISVAKPRPDLIMHLCPERVKRIHTDQMSLDTGCHLFIL